MVLFSWLLYKSHGAVFRKEFPSFVVKKKYSDVIREPAYFPSTLPLRETSVVVGVLLTKIMMALVANHMSISKGQAGKHGG